MLNGIGTKAECAARLAEAQGAVRWGGSDVAVER